jgi:hypothetical protein
MTASRGQLRSARSAARTPNLAVSPGERFAVPLQEQQTPRCHNPCKRQCPEIPRLWAYQYSSTRERRMAISPRNLGTFSEPHTLQGGALTTKPSADFEWLPSMEIHLFRLSSHELTERWQTQIEGLLLFVASAYEPSVAQRRKQGRTLRARRRSFETLLRLPTNPAQQRMRVARGLRLPCQLPLR